MKTIKELFEVYKPKSPDEQKFVDKHVTIKHKDRNGNDDDVFKATNVKAIKRKEERHGYDSGEDEKVYEETEELGDEIVFELDEEVESLEEGTVGYKHYTITSHPKMQGAGEGGDIKHVFGHPKKMGKLGIEHDDSTDYGTTRRVTVKNNQTGETTHHHVYQSERSNSKGKPTLSIRTVGKPGAQQSSHANVIAHYLSGKTKIKEDTDLAFFEELLEMNLDEDTFTDASLAQLRVMKHKQEMKKIESSSKLHPLMKVRKLSDAKKKLADLEAARDHYAAKHEKAMSRKKKVNEEVNLEDLLDEALDLLTSIDEKTLTPAEMKKREEVVKAIKRENPKMDKSMAYAVATKTAKRVAEEAEELDELSKSTLKSYVKKSVSDLPKRGIAAQSKFDKGESDAALKQLHKIIKRQIGVDKAVDKMTKEEVEELEELSFKKLADYSAKSADSVSGAPVRKQDNRIKGQSLADKKIRKMDGYSSTAKVAATNEEVEEIEELSKATLGSYAKKASNQVLGKGIAGGMSLARNNAEGEAEGHKLVNKAVKRMTGVQKAVGKLTKEDIISRAIENYMPEDYTPPSLDEQFIAKIEHLSEAHAVTLLSLFDSLNEDNKITMISTVDTDEGIKSLLDFAIQNRGE